MKYIHNKSLVAAALSVALMPAVSVANKIDSRGMDLDGGKQVVTNSQSKRNIDDLYVVLLKDAPLASYQGELDSLQATSLQVNSQNRRANQYVLDVNSIASKKYLSHLAREKASAINSINKQIKREVAVLNNYQYALNGFSTRLNADEVASLSQVEEVLQVVKVEKRYIETDSGPNFIKAPTIWDGSATGGVGSKGEGVIVGIMDTGINPDSRSFADVGDDGYDHINPFGEGVYTGDCSVAEYSHYCNDKLIGIWGHPQLVADYTPAGEDPVAVDQNGHGSHTASTVAGNVVKNVPIFNVIGDEAQYEFEQISGVAPHANIISYQVCAADDGCYPDVTALAVEHAIENGVSVINYSVGGSASNPWTDVDGLAFLAARQAGIHVATSAGNSGPDDYTVGSPGNSPWLTTVAAYTHDRGYSDKSVSFSGGDTTPPDAMVGKAATDGISANVVFAGDFGDADCLTPFAADTFAGEIVVCERGDIARVSKGTNVLAGGAGGLILLNVGSEDETVNADFHVLPAIHLGFEHSSSLITWLASGDAHMATITSSSMTQNPELGDIAADFTSRGPEPIFEQYLTPHIAAPGVDIYAAHTEYQPWRSDADKTESPFTFMSGTSMSSPHVAGALALLKAVKPDWSPAEAQSAIMMTAHTDTVSHDGVTPSRFFDAGSGSIRLDKAVSTGLVMNATYDQYMAADPLNGGDPTTINMAAMVKQECMLECEWTRTFKADVAGTWSITGVPSVDGLSITATPASITLAKGEEATVTINAQILSGFGTEYGFGQLRLTPESSSLSTLNLPVIGTYIAGSLPEETLLDTNSSKGSASVPGISTTGSDDISVVPFELTELEVASVEIPRDDSDDANWPTNVYNDSSFMYTQLINVTPKTKRIVARIKDTTSPDLDMYIGRDANYNGIPDNALEMSDMPCQSATETQWESCIIDDPLPGSYFLAVHNYGNYDDPTGAMDTIEIEVAVIGEDDGSLMVDYNAGAGYGEDIELVVSWDRTMMSDTTYISAVEVGTTTEAPDNVGRTSIEIKRSATTLYTDMTMTNVDSGENIALSINIEENLTDEERVYTVELTKPELLSLASSSLDAIETDMAITWLVTVPAQSDAQQITVELDTSAMVMSQTVELSVSHFINEASDMTIVEALGAIDVEGIPVAMIDNQNSNTLSVNEQTSVVLTAQGSTVPNADDVITYVWTQTSGPEVTIADATAAEISLTLPDITSNSSAEFSLVVSNGTKTSEAATVIINMTADVPVVTEPVSSGGSGGGSLSMLSVLAAFGFGLRRRSQRQR